MLPKKHQAELLANERIADGLYRLLLAAPAIAEFSAPGQFVMVKASGKGSGSPLWRRPFSIHQVNKDQGQIRLLIKVVGDGTEFLASKKAGETLDLVGPLGKGFDLSSTEKSDNIWIIGGGVGIAPLYYLTTSLVAKGLKPKNIKVFLGGACSDDVNILENDFADLGVFVSIATDDGSSGYHGLVTDLFFNSVNASSVTNPLVFSCGPHPMMKAVARFCLERTWPCQVSLETLMACGISACLGCAVRGSGHIANIDDGNYLHVCKEGPVFEAGEVAWD